MMSRPIFAFLLTSERTLFGCLARSDDSLHVFLHLFSTLGHIGVWNDQYFTPIPVEDLQLCHFKSPWTWRKHIFPNFSSHACALGQRCAVPPCNATEEDSHFRQTFQHVNTHGKVIIKDFSCSELKTVHYFPLSYYRSNFCGSETGNTHQNCKALQNLPGWRRRKGEV